MIAPNIALNDVRAGALTGPSQPSAATAEQAHGEEAGDHHDESIGGMIMAMGWPIANFIILAGTLYYFLNKPLKEYLAGRSAAIRKDLVEAAEIKATANVRGSRSFRDIMSTTGLMI